MNLKGYSVPPSLLRLLGQGLVSSNSLLVALGVTGVFGASVFGSFSLMIIIGNILANVLRAALVEPATRVASQQDRDVRVVYFASLASVTLVGMAVVALPFCALLSWSNRIMLDDPDAVTSSIATIFIFSFVGSEILRAFFQAFASSQQVFIFDLLRTGLSLMALSLCLWKLDNAGVLSRPDLVMIGQAIAFVLSVALVALHRIPLILRVRPIKFGLIPYAHSGYVTSLVAILRSLQVNLPLLIAQYLLGEAVLGVIRTWQSLANVVSLPSKALRLNIMASGARFFLSEGMTYLVDYVRRMAFRVLGLAIMMMVPVMSLIFFLPHRFEIGREGLAYLTLFLLFNFFTNMNATMTTVFIAADHLKALLFRTLISLAISVVISPLSVYLIGGLGVPLAQLTTAVIVFCISIIALGRMRAGELG